MSGLAHRDRGAGRGIYNPITLRLYDFGVLGLTNSLIWRCPTRHISDLYRAHSGRRHLDIGPGTGYYLADLPATDEITLLDLNADSISAARARIGTAAGVEGVHQSFFDPLPPHRWDSIGATFLLHCIPDPAKWDHLAALSDALTPGGTLFGATVILDRSAGPAARALNGLYNRIGVFGNTADHPDDLRNALRDWDDVHLERRGQVVLFTARRPERTAA